MDLKPGDVLDRYELVSLIGEGGAAHVWRGRHQALGTEHALKVLHLVSEGVRQRMLLEARVQAQLRHPNIVPVNDVFFHGRQPVVVMDFVDGPNLEQWINRTRPGPLQAEQVFRGILAGVTAAHAQGVIHRDLKPANVLVEMRGGKPVPRVTDFGLARVLEDVGPRRTRMGVAMGTPGYMAPEMMAAAPTADERADVFSLGCVLYALICHRTPFSGRSQFEVFQAIRSGDYLDPIALVPGISQGQRAAIQGALITEVERRIPSCQVLGEVLDLKRGWGGEGATWTRPTGWKTMMIDPDEEATQVMRPDMLDSPTDVHASPGIQRRSPPPPPPGIVETLTPGELSLSDAELVDTEPDRTERKPPKRRPEPTEPSSGGMIIIILLAGFGIVFFLALGIGILLWVASRT